MKKIMFMLVSLVMGGAFFSVFANVRFVDLSERYKSRVSIVNFYNGTGSNIQNAYGFIILKGVNYIEGERIKLGNEEIKCTGKLRGYYVNLARGNYLYPLSPEDKNNFVKLLNGDANIEVTGGFYTACEGEGIDNNSVVGYIKYKYKINGMPYFRLYAGLKFNIYENTIEFDEGFADNLKLVNGAILMGFIYDTVGGVGFVGGRIYGSKKMNSGNKVGVTDLKRWLANKKLSIKVRKDGEIEINGEKIQMETMYSIVQSSVGIAGLFNVSVGSFSNLHGKKLFVNQVSVDEQDGAKKRFGYSAGLINFSDVNNTVRRNAESLCRNREWEEVSNNRTIEVTNLGVINCFKGEGKLIINSDPTSNRKNTIIVSKGVDIIISKPMIGDGYVEMYVDKARLLIDNDIKLVEIGENGEPVNNNGVTSGAVIKGLFVINGLLGGYDRTNGAYTGFVHKLYVLGQFASLNTIAHPSDARLNFVRNLLEDNTIDEGDINLLRIFKWDCDTGVGTDGVNCSHEKDRWWQNSIIFIPKKYSYRLLR